MIFYLRNLCVYFQMTLSMMLDVSFVYKVLQETVRYIKTELLYLKIKTIHFSDSCAGQCNNCIILLI